MQLLPSWPCSQLPHASLEDTRPTRSTTQAASLQLEGFKLQTSRKWISEQGLFFFLFWREAEKSALLGSCCPRLLKTLGGLRPTQEASGCWLRPEPHRLGPSPNLGAPKFPSEEYAPFPDTPDGFSCTDAGPAPGIAPYNEAAPARNVCKSWGSAQGSGSRGTAANPRIKAEAILLTIHSCLSPKSIHNRTVKLMFPLLLQTIVKMIGICL